MRGVRPRHDLAQALGKKLGCRQILQRGLPPRWCAHRAIRCGAGAYSWLNCARRQSCSVQLDLQAAAFDDFDPVRDAVWMAEVVEESTHVWSTQPRIAMFLAGMRHFAQALCNAGRFTIPGSTTPVIGERRQPNSTPPSNAWHQRGW